jgi:hypothetical protein
MYPHRCIFAYLVHSDAPNVTWDEAGEQAFHDGQKWGLPLRAVACIGFMLLRVDEKSGTGKLISVHSALTENLRCTI